MMILAFVAGCVTSARVTHQPVANQGPSVARLDDGRQGFVIRENPGMDAESRSEFERAVALMNDGKNDKAIELLTKVIERLARQQKFDYIFDNAAVLWAPRHVDLTNEVIREFNTSGGK